MRGLGLGILIPLALIVLLWLVGPAFGFRISLLGSLGLSLLLTVVLNVVLAAFARRRGQRTRW